MNTKQIEQIKKIGTWANTRFHGNTKNVGSIPIADYLLIVKKKNDRANLKNSCKIKVSDAKKVRELIQRTLQDIGTNYGKIMIEGNTNIYYASPIYLHNDYNKSIVFPKNEKTLKLMDLFKSYIDRKINLVIIK